jgi:hypothetical protein
MIRAEEPRLGLARRVESEGVAVSDYGRRTPLDFKRIGIESTARREALLKRIHAPFAVGSRARPSVMKRL